MVDTLRGFFREFVCDIVIFMYKIGEALLDACIRPYIYNVVCSDMLHGGNRNLSGLPEYHVHYRVRVSLPHWLSESSDVCSQPNRLPEEISDEVQRKAAGVVVAHRLLTSVPAIILGLFCGAWSDTRGRKLPVMVPSAGSCIAVVFYMATLQVHDTKVALLLAGAATQGLFGKSQLILMALNSYVSDTSDNEQRTKRLGRLLGSTFLGIFLGSYLAVILQENFGLGITLIMVSICHASCMLVSLFGLTEGVTRKDLTTSGYKELGSDTSSDDVETKDEEEGRRKTGGGRKSEDAGLFSWQSLKDSVMAVVKKREGQKRSIIFLTLISIALNQILKIGDQDVTVLFVQRPPLSWPAYFYGYLLAVDYGVMGFSLIFILPVLSNVLSLSDTHIVLLAILFKLVRGLWAGFCTRSWMMLTSMACGALGGLINPGLRSILSKTAGGEEVGKLFSIQAGVETLSKLIGSSVFTGIYAATVDLFPPAAYLAEVAVYLLMAALLLWLGRLFEREGAHELLLNVPKPYQSVSKRDDGLKESLCSLEKSPVIRDKDQPSEEKLRNGFSRKP